MVTSIDPALTGEYEQSVDDKGRVFVPPAIRAPLGDEFVVTRGPDKVIWLLAKTQWDLVYRQMGEPGESLYDRNVAVLRRLHSGYALGHTDTGSRLTIPRHIREHAGITDESNRVVLIGVGDKVEIWLKQTWRDYSNEHFKLEIGRASCRE